jgi:hypothetical protein
VSNDEVVNIFLKNDKCGAKDDIQMAKEFGTIKV